MPKKKEVTPSLGVTTLYFKEPTSVTFIENTIVLRDGSGKIILQVSSETTMKLRLLQPVSLTGLPPLNTSNLA